MGDDRRDFLAVATPGAGKTTFALTCARWALAQERRRLIVVAPTSHLKLQWTLAAHRLGLELDPDWSPGGGVAKDVHGIVTTFQHVATADTANVLRGASNDAFVILDEVHHTGDERAWGDAVRHAFAGAHRRLCLSGTPFRSDTAAIPFVRYDDGEACADYEYGYGDALRDGGVVRPVYFPRIDGEMEWSAPDGAVVSASFQDELDRDGMSHRLRAALSVEGEWLPHVLEDADRRLQHIRSTQQADAGGLVIAIDQAHAHAIARMIRTRLGAAASVVVSDDPAASNKIAEFAHSDAAWLVSVRMVSEGVDIPRLRVGVYASTVATELFFRQAVGRFVRWQSGMSPQKAYVYLPDDVRLRTHAFQIMESRRHVLRRADADDDTTWTGIAERDAPFDASGGDSAPEQLSLFSMLSAVATRMQMHSLDPSGVAIAHEFGADEEEAFEPDSSDLALLELDLPDIPTDAGWAPHGGRSVFEIKDQLRERNADLAKRLVDVTGWSHSRVNGEMNRLANVARVSSATTDQLERRLRKAEEWLAQLRRRGG